MNIEAKLSKTCQHWEFTLDFRLASNIHDWMSIAQCTSSVDVIEKPKGTFVFSLGNRNSSNLDLYYLN